MAIDPNPNGAGNDPFVNQSNNDPGANEDETAAIYQVLTAIHQDIENNIVLEHCKQEMNQGIDLASLGLAILSYNLYRRYYDKYEDVVEWRDEIGQQVKDCLNQDIQHYINFVMEHMDQAITDVMNLPVVTVEYREILERYCAYAETSAQAAKNLLTLSDHKNCPGCAECQQCADDISGWAIAAGISAADDRVRFDEERVPRRLNSISAALQSVHSATFSLPGYDYQAFQAGTGLITSLASAYAGIANSTLGSFGYFSTNFINSVTN